MHTVSRGNRKGGRVDGEQELGHGASGRAVTGDGRRVDLRPRSGGTESDRVRGQAFSEGDFMNAPGILLFKLNGASVEAQVGETIIEVADRLGVEIPRLCYKPGMRPDGNCRACMVEIKGERGVAPSCCGNPAAG